MQKKLSSESGLLCARVLLSVGLFSAALFLALLSLAAPPTPAAGTLNLTNRTLTYVEPPGMQTQNDTGVALGKPNCTIPTSCSTFNLTIDPSVGTPSAGYDPAQNRIKMTWSWLVATVDYDIFVEDALDNVVASNRSTADPSAIFRPATTPAGL